MTPPQHRVPPIARALVQHRALSVLAVVLLVGAAVAGVAVRGLHADISPQALFTTFEDQKEIDAAFVATFGETENIVTILVEADDVMRPDVLQYVHDLAGAFEHRPWADRVSAPTNLPIPRAGAPGELIVDSPIRGNTVDPDEIDDLRAALAGSHFVEGTLISASRRVAIVAIALAPGWETIAQLQPVVDEVDAELAARPPPDGVTTSLTGIPIIRVDVVDRILNDQKTLLPLAMLATGIMLLLAFRWWPAIVFPTAAVAMSTALLVGGMAWAGEPFNIINQMLPILLLVIGISDAIHLVARYGEESSLHDARGAAARTLATMAVACFLTSFTTAVGFGSLAMSRTEILARFGVTAAIGVLGAWIVTIVFLPPALTFAPRPSRALLEHTDGPLERVLDRIVTFVMRHTTAVMVVAFATLVGATVVASRTPIDTTLLETFPEGDPVARQVHLLQDELDGILPLEISLMSDTEGRFDDPAVLTAVFELQQWVRQQQGVLRVTSWDDMLRDAWVAYSGDDERRTAPFTSEAQVAQLASLLEGGVDDPLAPWVTPDRRHMRVQVKMEDEGSRAALELVRPLQIEIDRLFGDFDDVQVELTGDAYTGSIGLTSLIHDMLTSLGTAFIIIFIFMSLLFRSLRMGLISVPPNIIPLVMTLAWMSLTGINLNTSTVIIFSISLGLAVDDTIHMLARFQEETRAGRSRDEAIHIATRGSGRAIVVTSAMLLAGMVVIYQGSFVPTRLFAELTAITIAGCLVGDLIVLPALLHRFWPENRAA